MAASLAVSARVGAQPDAQAAVMNMFRSFFSGSVALAMLTACPAMDEDDDGGSDPTAATQAESSASGSGSSTGTDPTVTRGSETTDETESSASGSGAPTGTTGEDPPSFSMSGTVTRSAVLPPEGDGIGTLVVGALASCTLRNPVLLGASIVPDADLSGAASSVPFTIEDLGGEVFLAAFLDDDGNLDPDNPRPDDGDPVLAEVAGDGVLTCIELVVDEDLEDVHIDLNEIAMPL